MSNELGQPITVVSPRTGEIIPLDAPLETLGEYLQDAREFKSVLNEAQNLVQREIISRLDRGAKWTVHAGGLKLVSSSPKPEEVWDGADLRQALLAFVDSGVLSIEAVDAAVATVVSYKVSKRGVDSLRALGGEVAEAIEGLKRVEEKTRRVQVSRA